MANGGGLVEVIKRAVPVAGFMGLAYLGETGQDGGFVRDIWAALKTATPPVAMILFIMYLDERKERKEAQVQCMNRTIDFVNTTNRAAQTFEKVLARLHRGRNKG